MIKAAQMDSENPKGLMGLFVNPSQEDKSLPSMVLRLIETVQASSQERFRLFVIPIAALASPDMLLRTEVIPNFSV